MKKTIAALMVVLAVPAFAQTEQEKKKALPVQHIDIDSSDVIEGGTVGPVGEFYGIPKRPDFKRLIKVRMNFDDKLRESVHEM